MRLVLLRALGILGFCAVASQSQASVAYFNLPPSVHNPPGVASNVELADDLMLDLSGGSTVQSASLRIVGDDIATSQAQIRLSLYTDNNGQPGTLLTTTALTIDPGGPAAYDQVFDLPDVTLSSPLIWAGFVFEVLPQSGPWVGTGTLPTIGSTTSRGASGAPGNWIVNGASGPPPGGGYYLGDRIQIGITTIPAPGTLLLLVPVVGAMRRRR